MRKAEDAAADYLSEDIGGGSPGPGISYALDDDGREIDANYPE